MSYESLLPEVLGTYKEQEKKKKIPYKGYRLGKPSDKKSTYSNEFVAHVRWLQKTKSVNQVLEMFPEIAASTLKAILYGFTRGKIDAQMSINYPID